MTRRLGRQLEEIEHQALHDGADRPAQPRALQDADRGRARCVEAAAAWPRPCCSSTSTASRRSTTRSGTRSATGCSRRSQRACAACMPSVRHRRAAGRRRVRRRLRPAQATRQRARSSPERVRTQLERPFAIGGLTLEVEASIGIALFPEHGEDVETLMRHADVAMYVSKEHARARIVYAAEDDHYSPDRLALVGELRRAIEDERARRALPAAASTCATGAVARRRGARPLAAPGARAAAPGGVRPARRAHRADQAAHAVRARCRAARLSAPGAGEGSRPRCR